MRIYKNVAVTGARQTGKSTLALWLLAQLGLPVAGYQTLRCAMTEVGPLYEMTDLLSGASCPISRQTPEGIRGIPESFDVFGAKLLTQALTAAAPVVLLDEIGRFEQQSPAFLQGLTDLLNSHKTIIAVLKQEPLSHILAIRERADTLLIDLNLCSFDNAQALLKKWLQTR